VLDEGNMFQRAQDQLYSAHNNVRRREVGGELSSWQVWNYRYLSTQLVPGSILLIQSFLLFVKYNNAHWQTNG